MNNYIQLSNYAKHMQIKKGDVVFVSSDSKKMAFDAINNKCEPNLNQFIDGIINEIGEDGTLLIPTYNWDFCKGITFDYKNTKCRVGALGTIALSRNDFRRTTHPIYSFAVYGKDQKLLCGLDYKDSFGIESIFNYLKAQNATNYVIDVSLKNSFTFTHYVEQSSGIVNHRIVKEFIADYIDSNGYKTKKTYSMFVRDLNKDVNTLIDPIENDLISKEAETIIKINNSEIKRIELSKAYDILIDDILNNKSRKLCTYIGQ